MFHNSNTNCTFLCRNHDLDHSQWTSAIYEQIYERLLLLFLLVRFHLWIRLRYARAASTFSWCVLFRMLSSFCLLVYRWYIGREMREGKRQENRSIAVLCIVSYFVNVGTQQETFPGVDDARRHRRWPMASQPVDDEDCASRGRWIRSSVLCWIAGVATRLAVSHPTTSERRVENTEGDIGASQCCWQAHPDARPPLFSSVTIAAAVER